MAASSPILTLRVPQPASAWRIALPSLALVLAAVLLLYRDTAMGMVGIWVRSATFTHAFLVPPIVAWLLWRQRDRLAAITPRANAWMLLPASALAGAWLLGELAAVNAVTQLAFVAMLVLAVPAVLGVRFAREAAFPLAFLFFAVPLGEFLLPGLMRMTADFTVAALRLSGVPVFREGQSFVIPSGKWSVVEACSGVRYLIASLMVGTLYAYLTYRSTRRRLAFMAVALVVPVVANWLRAYLIVMLGHLSDNRIATGVDHLIYGWIFFGIVIFSLYGIGARWAEPAAAVPSANPRQARLSTPASSPWVTAIVAATLVLVALAPLSLRSAILQHESAAVPVLPPPAPPGHGWSVGAAMPVDWRPRLDNPSAVSDAVYVAQASAPVGLHLAYFRNQGSTRKLDGSNALLSQSEDKRWTRVAEGRREIVVGSRAVDVRTAELRDRDDIGGPAGASVVAWQFYWAGDAFTGSDTVAKARVALDRLLGRGDDAAEIVVYASAATPEAAERALDAFVRADLDPLGAALAAVRSRR